MTKSGNKLYVGPALGRLLGVLTENCEATLRVHGKERREKK